MRVVLYWHCPNCGQRWERGCATWKQYLQRAAEDRTAVDCGLCRRGIRLMDYHPDPDVR